MECLSIDSHFEQRFFGSTVREKSTLRINFLLDKINQSEFIIIFGVDFIVDAAHKSVEELGKTVVP